jgi:hypothetical protein
LTLSFCSVLHVRGVPLWLWLAQLAQLTTPFDQPRILLALGVIASTLQGVATMQTQVSLSQRNAERFALLRLRFNQPGLRRRICPRRRPQPWRAINRRCSSSPGV